MIIPDTYMQSSGQEFEGVDQISRLYGQDIIALVSYDRASILNGELWRIATSHLSHTGFNHLALNMFGPIMIFLVFGQLFSTRFWLLSLAVTMAGTGIGLFVFCPGLGWYMGFSGVLHGLIVIGIIGAIKDRWHFGYFVLLMLAAKLIHEHLYGPSPGMMNFINSPVIVDAHLYGAITGALFALFYMSYGKRLVSERP